MKTIIDRQLKRVNYNNSLLEHVNVSLTGQLSIANFIYNCNKIGGSNLTPEDTFKILDTNSAYTVEQKEVHGIQTALNYLSDNVDCEIEVGDLTTLCDLLLRNVRPDSAGIYRTTPAYTYVELSNGSIKRHYCLDHTLIEESIRNLFERDIRTLDEVIEFVLKLASTHPFKESNDKVLILVLNWLLIQIDYPTVTIHDKVSYVDAIDAYLVNKDSTKFKYLVEAELIVVLKHFK